MRRRTVLSAVGACSLAGCLASAAGPTESDDPESGTSDDHGDTDTPTFGGCPSFVADADRTVCWTDHGDADVYLRPSSRTFAESETYQAVDTVTFTLVNAGDRDVGVNPYDWAVERRTTDGWSHVAPDGAHVQPLDVVAPGESHEWRLASTEHPSGNVDGRTDVVADLPAEGTYAFHLHGTVDSGEDAHHVEWIARFEYVLSDQG